jgi:hypothetical protein
MNLRLDQSSKQIQNTVQVQHIVTDHLHNSASLISRLKRKDLWEMVYLCVAIALYVGVVCFVIKERVFG